MSKELAFTIFSFSLVTFISYVLYVLRSLKQIPASLSETYYKLNRKNRGGWMFVTTLFICGCSLLPLWLEFSPENIQFLVFFSSASILFVASAPEYEQPLTVSVHYVAAVICCLSAILWCLLSGYWLVVVLVFGLASIPVIKSFINLVFWVEIATFLSVYIVLAMLIYQS